MVKETNYLLSEREDGIRYVVAGDYLYVRGSMYQLEEIHPYIKGKRGLYLLIGQSRYYVGEGEVYGRLTKHKVNKGWVEDVYVVVKTGNSNMDKEESLQFEGSLNSYVRDNTNLTIDNIDKTREDDYEIGQHIKCFNWIGLDLPKKEYFKIKAEDNQEVIVMRTVKGLYTIVKSSQGLEWLEGYYFEKLGSISDIIGLIGKGVCNKWV